MDYVILRGIYPEGMARVPCERGRPKRVLTLLDEADFVQTLKPVHNKNVFFEDHYHDWNFVNGMLLYYSRIRTHADAGNDVVLIY